MPRPILVIGHSHIEAIRRAACVRRERDPDRPRTRTIYMLDPVFGGPTSEDGTRFSTGLTAAILEQIERHDPVIASVIRGNGHAALSLIHRHRFDFELTDEYEPLPLG